MDSFQKILLGAAGLFGVAASVAAASETKPDRVAGTDGDDDDEASDAEVAKSVQYGKGAAIDALKSDLAREKKEAEIARLTTKEKGFEAKAARAETAAARREGAQQQREVAAARFRVKAAQAAKKREDKSGMILIGRVG